ncbi:MAG: rhodanese-like domain-containing protein [Verrucomicrobiaceae bacterium]
MTAVAEQESALSGDTTMSQLLQIYPGAQRALFARYHIGGCRSCGFQPDETLAEVCARNENLSVSEVIAHIHESHDADAKIQISPQELAALLKSNPALKLIDVRSREEHEAVAIPGSRLMTQDLTQELFSTSSKTEPIIIYDHHGDRALDAAAYFIGHGFAETKCLAGGIDVYSLEVDASLPRYRVELEE